jgi:hypothetical protein
MHTLTTRRSMIVCLVIVLLTATAIYRLDRFGRSSRVFGRTGTMQARHIVQKRVDNPDDAYRIWREAGYRGRTIVFVSDRWESFDPGELIPTQMYRAYPLQLYNTAKLFEDDYLNGVTFLYVASLNKIVRKIVAIVPESEVGRMKEVARRVKNSQVSDRGVYITRQGFPRWFTTGAKFDGTGEPALLYIGASYFRNAEPEDLYRQLSSSGLQTDCVILCDEKGKADVTAIEIARLTRFARLIGISTAAEVSGNMKTSGTEMQQGTLPAS